MFPLFVIMNNIVQQAVEELILQKCSEESFQEAFTYLRHLTKQKIVSQEVFRTICRLTREGRFTSILRQARGGKLSPAEQRFLKSVAA